MRSRYASLSLIVGLLVAATSVKAFVGGPSESGKSCLLRELFTAQCPRVITVEFVPEAHKYNRDVIQAFGYAQLKEVLAETTRPIYERWHVAFIPRDDAELRRFARLLLPTATSEASRSIAEVVGGIALEFHELSLFAPSGRTAPEIRALFVLGRHKRISILGAAQRPAIVDRCCTSEAHALVSMRAHEWNDVKWWAQTTTPDVADRIKRLPDYHSLFYRPRSPVVYVLDARYRAVERISLLADAEASA